MTDYTCCVQTDMVGTHLVDMMKNAATGSSEATPADQAGLHPTPPTTNNPGILMYHSVRDCKV